MLLTVLGTVVFTALAGVVFAELRRRSGSIVAPLGLHWATNGLAVVAAARVWEVSPPASGRRLLRTGVAAGGANSCSRTASRCSSARSIAAIWSGLAGRS